MRGKLVPLTARQRVIRMRYLARLEPVSALDAGIVRPSKHDPQALCPIVHYRLKDHNGGKDPTALNHGTVWHETDAKGVKHPRLTSDCVGGMAWACGFDRYQPELFKHLYGGWINTDSMLLDARDQGLCFELLDRPEPGCLIVFGSGTGGHRVGHVGGVIEVPAEWDARSIECWKGLRIVDQASRTPGNAVSRLDWRRLSPSFLRPVIADLAS